MTVHRTLRSVFIAGIAALLVDATGTKIYAASPNSPPQGSDFPVAEIRSFQMHVTSSEEVVKALGQPFNVYSADGIGPNFSRVLDFQYVYSETGSCYPRNWAHFRFNNEILEEYDAFGERPGDSRVDLATRDAPGWHKPQRRSQRVWHARLLGNEPCLRESARTGRLLLGS